jgi:hypothetical protein
MNCATSRTSEEEETTDRFVTVIYKLLGHNTRTFFFIHVAEEKRAIIKTTIINSNTVFI